MPNFDKIAQHGPRIAEQIESILHVSLRHATTEDLRKATLTLSADDMDQLLYSVVRSHRDFAPCAADVQSDSSVSYSVLDASNYPYSPAHVKSLLCYSEGVLIPDPFLDHPIALRAIVPQHFHSQFPYGLPTLRELLLKAVQFYADFQYGIRSGAIIPSGWPVLAAMPQEIQNHYLGERLAIIGPKDPASEEILRIATQQAKVYHSEFKNGASIIHPGMPVTAGRTSQIGILFEGDPRSARIHVETHFHMLALADNGRVGMTQGPPATQSEVDIWVASSIAKAAHNRAIALKADMLEATARNAPVVTTSSFSWELLRILGRANGSDPRSMPEEVMYAIELPFLDQLSLNALLRAREDSEALELFRKGLRDVCKNVKTSPGTSEFRKDVQAVATDFVGSGVDKLKARYKELRYKSASDIALSVLALGVTGSGLMVDSMAWTPAILAGLNQLKSFRDAALTNTELKKEPLYMLWNATRRPFQAK